MAFRDIVVQVDASVASERRARYAARVADHLKAHLTGVFLRPTITYQYFRGGVSVDVPLTVPQPAIDAYNEAMDRTERAARARFEDATASGGQSRSWRSLNADFGDELIAAMRRTDLTVLPQGHMPIVAERDADAASLTLQSGAPVLILPDGAAEGPIGRRILVAWNGSREAARALREAWPLISGAEQVCVLIVGETSQDASEPELRQLFERHQVRANFIFREGDDGSAGRAMLEEVTGQAIDLVVMGLYGHSRWRETVLGGASRQMTRHSPVALFVSH